MRAVISAAAVLTLSLVGFARAEDKPEGAKPDREGRKAEFIKKFDKDGDGQLNDEEKTAAREAFHKHMGERGDGGRRGGPDREALKKQFDKDGDGKLNDEERAAARAKFEGKRGKHGGGGREAILKHFDKDGDGKLSDEEKTAAKEAMKHRRHHRRGGEGKPEAKDPAAAAE